MTKKKCFVICPIGPNNSPTRKRSDSVHKHIISKALDRFEIVRADNITTPGQITMQVIENIVESYIVIADLTDNNANVFYELALRHALSKPAILIAQEDQLNDVPFDLKDMRIIPYKLDDLDFVDRTRHEIADHVAAIDGELSSANIISRYVTLAPVCEPGGPDEIRVTLGTINIGNRFRYELIEPFFETLEMDFRGRLKRLRNSFGELMEESRRKDYLKRGTVQAAFMYDKESYETLEHLFSDVETIIPSLVQAMYDEDEEEIFSTLKRWRQNNTDFMRIASKRLSELMSLG